MVSETVIREFKQIVDQENVFSDITDRVPIPMMPRL